MHQCVLLTLNCLVAVVNFLNTKTHFSEETAEFSFENTDVKSICSCKQRMKSKLSLSSQCIKTKVCRPCTSFTSYLHSSCGMVWYRTLRVKTLEKLTHPLLVPCHCMSIICVACAGEGAGPVWWATPGQAAAGDAGEHLWGGEAAHHQRNGGPYGTCALPHSPFSFHFFNWLWLLMVFMPLVLLWSLQWLFFLGHYFGPIWESIICQWTDFELLCIYVHICYRHVQPQSIFSAFFPLVSFYPCFLFLSFFFCLCLSLSLALCVSLPPSAFLSLSASLCVCLSLFLSLSVSVSPFPPFPTPPPRSLSLSPLPPSLSLSPCF